MIQVSRKRSSEHDLNIIDPKKKYFGEIRYNFQDQVSPVQFVTLVHGNDVQKEKSSNLVIINKIYKNYTNTKPNEKFTGTFEYNKAGSLY